MLPFELERTILAVVALASLSWLGGCATPREIAQAAAVERASREYRCPKAQVKTRFLGRHEDHFIFNALACGYTSNYACYGEEVSQKGGCVKESRP